MSIGNSWLLISCMLIVGILLSHGTHMIVATEGVSGSSFDRIPSHDFPSKVNVVINDPRTDPLPPLPPAGGGPIHPISSNLPSSPP
ncbi:hypothetical protein QQP08_016783 [Theobroma cacao]|nr:hypothetical protein QQP08_016783 [Theobroma cacao]